MVSDSVLLRAGARGSRLRCVVTNFFTNSESRETESSLWPCSEGNALQANTWPTLLKPSGLSTPDCTFCNSMLFGHPELVQKYSMELLFKIDIPYMLV